MDLALTIKFMTSINYKERFKAEYWQTKERYERLKRFCNIIEAQQQITSGINNGELEREIPQKLPHDCPLSLLRRQLDTMREYIDVLEVRATIENIELEDLK